MTQATEPKRLYRSDDNKIIGGICGGIAEYANMDPVVIRVIAVLVLLMTSGGAAVAYVILLFIIPRKSDLGKTGGSGSHSSGRDGDSGPILDRK